MMVNFLNKEIVEVELYPVRMGTLEWTRRGGAPVYPSVGILVLHNIKWLPSKCSLVKHFIESVYSANCHEM